MILEFEDIFIDHFGVFKIASVSFAEIGLGVCFVQGRNKVEPRLGSNGAGKTTIWNALSWCLYGKTVGGLKGTDIKPWGGKEKAIVTVTILKGQTRTQLERHTIRRSTVTNGLWLDGKVCSQETIDELLGLSFTTFPHTILLGQGAPLFFDLKAKEKMDVLSEALELDRWEERSKRAGKKAHEMDVQIGGLSIKLGQMESQLVEARGQVTHYKNKSQVWEDEQADKTEDHDKKLRAINKRLADAQDKWGKADLAYDGAETELRALQRTIAEEGIRLIELHADSATKQAEFDQTAATLKGLRADRKSSKAGEPCPTCGQSLSGAVLKKHNQELDSAIAEYEKSLSAKKQQLESAKDKVNIARARLAKSELHAKVFREKSNDAIDARSRHETTMKEFEAEAKAITKLKEEAGENPYSESLADARKRVKKLKTLMDEADDLLASASRKHTRIKYWVDGFKNVRLYLLQEVLDELTGVTQTLLPQIGLDGWEVRYAMERETQSGKLSTGLNVSIFKPGLDKAVRWESWSGGEGQRLRLVGAMALSEVILRRAGVECDLMVLDEPTRHLSPEGVAETCDFLIDRGRDMQLFYVDHQAIENKRFRRVMTVTRTTKGATIDVR